jgi:hypothetical protein
MELDNATRNEMVAAIKTKIDGASPAAAGKINFYDKTGIFIISLPFALPSMTILNGVGTFYDTLPTLNGTVLPGNGGIANRWTMTNGAVSPAVVATGTCGDPDHTGKDIQFNNLTWNDYDNVSITGLSITVPTGSNDYIP